MTLVEAKYDATAATTADRHVVRDRLGGTHKTMLTLDGGGTRCMLTVMILRQLENEIKRHLLANHTVLLTKPAAAVVKAENESKFDIHLGDYFQFVAGVSMGSVIASYIAVRGKGSDKLVEDDEDFREGCVELCDYLKNERGDNDILDDDAYPELSKDAVKEVLAAALNGPGNTRDTSSANSSLKVKIKEAFPRGSMLRLEIVFRHCTSKFFSEVAPLKFSKQGPENFLNSILCDTLASEVKTSLLVSTFDNLTYKGYCFVARPGKGEADGKIFLREEGWLDDDSIWTPGKLISQTKRREFGGLGTPSGDYDKFLGKSDGKAGIEVVDKPAKVTNKPATLYLKDLARASTAMLNTFDIVVMHIEKASGSDPKEEDVGTVALSDGATLSNDPTLQALAAARLGRETNWEPNEMAILSVGSGLTTRPGGMQPSSSVPNWPSMITDVEKMDAVSLMLHQIETTSRYIPHSLRFSLQNDSNYDEGQYTRLQIVASTDDEETALVKLNDPSKVEAIYGLGKKTIFAADQPVNKRIKDFVKHYVFGEKRDSP